MTQAPIALPPVSTTTRMVWCCLSGFSSGLPLFVLLNLVPAWLKTEGVSLAAIGAFALIQLPYTWKFFYSPLLDRFQFGWLGRRRDWMLLTQLLLLLSMGALGYLSPGYNTYSIAALAVLVALFSASQDIAIDAFRREILPDAELGLGNSLHINLYRLSSLVPGSLSLILADHLSWSSVFVITALFMLPGLVLTLIAREQVREDAPTSLEQAVVEPFREFWQRQGVAASLRFLAFLVLYKLGDSLATSLATPFYLDIGFSKTEIGLVAKNAGLWMSVAGALIGGALMMKWSMTRALWVFGLVQWVTILGFVWLAEAGADLWVLGVAVGLEALGVGLGTAAFVAFIAHNTHPAYAATQFALFTSLAAIPRTVVNAYAGVWVEALGGWTPFFWLSFALGVPGMVLLWWVGNEKKR